jgi:hypothetical protein
MLFTVLYQFQSIQQEGMYMLKRFASLAALLTAITISSQASAALLTSDVGYGGPTLDLTAQQNGNYNFTFGPVSLPGGITFTRDPSTASNSGQGAVLGQGGYGLGANGNFGGDAVYAGLDGAEGWIRFALSAPVSSFGLYVNYAPGVGPDPIIAALDQFGNVVEQYNLATDAPVSTPSGFNQFEFRGISLNSANIWTFQLSNSYILAAATANGAPTPVPEPETLAIVAIGLLGMSVARRRRYH